jgi:hypothetical protein
VAFDEILPILRDARPRLNLSLEICQSTEDKRRAAHPRQCIQIDDPVWRSGHPDLTVEERAAFLDLIDSFENRIDAGEIETWESFETRNFGYPTYENQAYGFPEAVGVIHASRQHIAGLLGPRDG